MDVRRFVFPLSILLTVLIGYYDYQTGAHISMMLLFAVPVLLSAWYCGRREGFFVALLASTFWFAVNIIYNKTVTSDAIISWNALTRLGIFCLIAYSVSLQAQLRKALERERLRGDTDRLTGLLNKGAFRERAEDEINRARRYNHPLSLAFIDLDNFKLINDIQGHARGDTLLQFVSETITNSIRNTDFCGRIGGDEFVICFPETGEEDIRQAIAKLVDEFNIMTSQSGWQVTASIGVVTCPTVSDSYDTLLDKADKQMYIAKERGKNTVEYMTLN